MVYAIRIFFDDLENVKPRRSYSADDRAILSLSPRCKTTALSVIAGRSLPIASIHSSMAATAAASAHRERGRLHEPQAAEAMHGRLLWRRSWHPPLLELAEAMPALHSWSHTSLGPCRTQSNRNGREGGGEPPRQGQPASLSFMGLISGRSNCRRRAVEREAAVAAGSFRLGFCNRFHLEWSTAGLSR